MKGKNKINGDAKYQFLYLQTASLLLYRLQRKLIIFYLYWSILATKKKKKQKIEKIFRKCPTNQDKPFFLRKKLEKKKKEKEIEMQTIEPHTFKMHVHYSTFELHFL